MCKCNKGIPANKSPIISGTFSVSNGNLRYSNNDFVVKYYVGETGNYTGSATGIDYGTRTYNTKSMVHASDYEADGQFFSDTEQTGSLAVPNTETNEVPPTNQTLSEQLDILTTQLNDYEDSQTPAESVTFKENVVNQEVLYKPKRETKKKEPVSENTV